MPFNPQATYIGGQLLGQGLQSLGQGIGGAIQNYQNISDQSTQANALMNYLHQQVDPVTGKPIIDDKTYQNFLQHDSRQQAFVAGGVQAGMSLAQALQAHGYATREAIQRGNLYQAQAQEAQGAGQTTTSVVTNPVTGEKVPVMQTGKGQPQILSTNVPGTIAYDTEGTRIGVYGPRNTIIRDRAPNALEGLFPGAFGGGAAQPAATPGTAPQVPAQPGAGYANVPSYLQQATPQTSPATAGPQAQAAPGPARPAAAGPQVGEQRMIQGRLAVWDGTGWKPAG